MGVQKVKTSIKVKRTLCHDKIFSSVKNALTCTANPGNTTIFFKFTLPEKKKCMEDYAPLDEGREAHWEVVERILFLYAKLNPGQSYVQVKMIIIFVAHNYNHQRY